MGSRFAHLANSQDNEEIYYNFFTLYKKKSQGLGSLIFLCTLIQKALRKLTSIWRCLAEVKRENAEIAESKRANGSDVLEKGRECETKSKTRKGEKHHMDFENKKENSGTKRNNIREQRIYMYVYYKYTFEYIYTNKRLMN